MSTLRFAFLYLLLPGVWPEWLRRREIVGRAP